MYTDFRGLLGGNFMLLFIYFWNQWGGGGVRVTSCWVVTIPPFRGWEQQASWFSLSPFWGSAGFCWTLMRLQVRRWWGWSQMVSQLPHLAPGLAGWVSWGQTAFLDAASARGRLNFLPGRLSLTGSSWLPQNEVPRNQSRSCQASFFFLIHSLIFGCADLCCFALGCSSLWSAGFSRCGNRPWDTGFSSFLHIKCYMSGSWVFFQHILAAHHLNCCYSHVKRLLLLFLSLNWWEVSEWEK